MTTFSSCYWYWWLYWMLLWREHCFEYIVNTGMKKKSITFFIESSKWVLRCWCCCCFHCFIQYKKNTTKMHMNTHFIILLSTQNVLNAMLFDKNRRFICSQTHYFVHIFRYLQLFSLPCFFLSCRPLTACLIVITVENDFVHSVVSLMMHFVLKWRKKNHLYTCIMVKHITHKCMYSVWTQCLRMGCGIFTMQSKRKQSKTKQTDKRENNTNAHPFIYTQTRENEPYIFWMQQTSTSG